MEKHIKVNYSFSFLSRKETNLLKGVAILMVLIGHLGLLNVAGIGVALFLYASGYGVFCSYRHKGLSHYFTNKIQKIWVPYALVFILSYAIHPCYDVPRFILSFFGMNPNPKTDPTMWYISFLFLFYLSFYFVFSIERKKLKFPLSCLLLSIILVLSLFVYDRSFGAVLYVPAFPLGVMMAKLSDKIAYRGIYSFMIFSIACLSYLCMQWNVVIYGMFIYAGGMSILIIVKRLSDYKSVIFSFLGKISYPIYLVEGLFLVKYKKEMMLFDSNITNYLLKIGGVIIAAVLLQWGMERSLQRKPSSNQ